MFSITAPKDTALHDIYISPLTDADAGHVEILLDAAFGPDRHGRTAYKLRENMTAIPSLSFVARQDGRIVGSLQCWPVELRVAGGGAELLVLLGPVAVEPRLQRGGVGKALMHHALTAADAEGAGAMMLIGDREYYGRFGFEAAPTQGWTLPGPFERHRLLARLTGGRALSREGEIGPRLA